MLHVTTRTSLTMTEHGLRSWVLSTLLLVLTVHAASATTKNTAKNTISNNNNNDEKRTREKKNSLNRIRRRQSGTKTYYHHHREVRSLLEPNRKRPHENISNNQYGGFFETLSDVSTSPDWWFGNSNNNNDQIHVMSMRVVPATESPTPQPQIEDNNNNSNNNNNNNNIGYTVLLKDGDIISSSDKPKTYDEINLSLSQEKDGNVILYSGTTGKPTTKSLLWMSNYKDKYLQKEEFFTTLKRNGNLVTRSGLPNDKILSKKVWETNSSYRNVKNDYYFVITNDKKELSIRKGSANNGKIVWTTKTNQNQGGGGESYKKEPTISPPIDSSSSSEYKLPSSPTIEITPAPSLSVPSVKPQNDLIKPTIVPNAIITQQPSKSPLIPTPSALITSPPTSLMPSSLIGNDAQFRDNNNNDDNFSQNFNDNLKITNSSLIEDDKNINLDEKISSSEGDNTNTSTDKFPIYASILIAVGIFLIVIGIYFISETRSS